MDPPPAYLHIPSAPPAWASYEPAPPPSAPPPSYAQVSDTQCTFVDFVPECLEGKGLFSSTPLYESFEVIFKRANNWLGTHPTWKVISCESAESKLKDSGHANADTSRSTYTVHSEDKTYYIRFLRLWVCNKTPADSPEPQQLRYVNFVPKCISEGGLFDRPDFETFSETVAKVNRVIRDRPIQGRVINMETQNMKFRTWSDSVDPDTSCWRESGEDKVYFLMVLRIFLEVGVGQVNRIGSVDAVPTGPKPFERFRQVMAKVNQWIERQPINLNVCNVQSIEYKLKYDEVDTNRSIYCEHGDRRTRFLRFVRIYWSQGSDDATIQRQSPLLVTYRTFMPDRESQHATVKRMLAWILATGAKVMSCETIKVREGDYHQNGDPEVTYASDSGDYRKHFIFGLRLYLDGHYQDPPPGVLPPRRRDDDDEVYEDCCTIL